MQYNITEVFATIQIQYSGYYNQFTFHVFSFLDVKDLVAMYSTSHKFRKYLEEETEYLTICKLLFTNMIDSGFVTQSKECVYHPIDSLNGENMIVHHAHAQHILIDMFDVNYLFGHINYYLLLFTYAFFYPVSNYADPLDRFVPSYLHYQFKGVFRIPYRLKYLKLSYYTNFQAKKHEEGPMKLIEQYTGVFTHFYSLIENTKLNQLLTPNYSVREYNNYFTNHGLVTFSISEIDIVSDIDMESPHQNFICINGKARRITNELKPLNNKIGVYC